MKTIKVNISDREVEVRELPLGDYAKLLETIDQIPKHLDKLTGLKDESELLMEVPRLVAACTKDFAKIISLSSNLTVEEIETSIGLAGATELVYEIIKINDYSLVWQNIKKVMAQLFQTQKKEVVETVQTAQ